MTRAIVKVLTTGHNVLYYTGRAGQDWISEDAAEAFEYSPQEASHKVAELQKMYAGVGLRFVAASKPTAPQIEAGCKADAGRSF